MELNVRSTIVPTMAAARQMIEASNGGAVLNITSVRADLGIAQWHKLFSRAARAPQPSAGASAGGAFLRGFDSCTVSSPK